MDRVPHARLIGVRRAVATLLVLAAFFLVTSTLLVRFFPDDGRDFELKSAVVGRICGGVHGGVSRSGDPAARLGPTERVEGVCASGQYDRLERAEAIPWLIPAILGAVAALVAAWRGVWLKAAAIGLACLTAGATVIVLRVPAEPGALQAKRILRAWLDDRPYARAISEVEVYQEQRGFTVALWSRQPSGKKPRSTARDIARSAAEQVQAVHVFVLGNQAQTLARWSAPGAPPPRQHPAVAEVVPSPS